MTPYEHAEKLAGARPLRVTAPLAACCKQTRTPPAATLQQQLKSIHMSIVQREEMQAVVALTAVLTSAAWRLVQGVHFGVVSSANC